MSHKQNHEGALAFTSVNSFRQFSLINDEDTTDLSTRQNQGGEKKTENKHNTIKKTWKKRI